MDLLESILRTCNAEKYIENFQSHRVDPFTLKILSDEDLQVLGINDQDMKQAILKHTENLPIPSEKQQDCTIDEQYILLILSQISIHLHKHYANLCYAAKRDDVDLCPIQTTPALSCINDCLESLENEIQKFEGKLIKKINKRKKINVLFPTIVTTSALIFVFVKYFKYSIK